MNDFSNIFSAILAGGLGTRLRSVVADQPKVLAGINGKPFIEYLFDQLSDYGIRNVVLCTGFLGEQIQKKFNDSYDKLNLLYSHESSPMGTAGALRLALPQLKSDTILVMNGDSYCKADLQSFLDWHYLQKAEASLLLTQSSDTRRFGRVKVDDNGNILSFVEKNETNEPGWINAGIYLVKHDFLQSIPPDIPVSLEREVFPSWIGRGLYGYKSEGFFLDIGTPESYALASQFFKNDIH